MKIEILSGLMFLLIILGTVVAAQQTEFKTGINCLDNNTLLTNLSETKCINGLCEPYSRIIFQTCNYGCDNITLSCAPDPFNEIIWYIIPIIIIFLVIIWIVIRRT